MKKFSASERMTGALHALDRRLVVTGKKNRSGNFGGKIDELVKHFPNEPAAARRQQSGEKAPPGPDDRHINDRLFESAWRKSRKERQESGFSNQ